MIPKNHYIAGIHTRSYAPALPVQNQRNMRDAAKRESARRVRINTLDMREFIRFHRLAKVSTIDVGARVVHSRSGINTRGFCKANQSQLFFTSAYTHTLSLFLLLCILFCTLLDCLKYTVISWSLHFGGPNETNEI